MDFPDSMTLGEARARYREIVKAGGDCPCCRRYGQIYHRKINSGMAMSLLKMFRAARRDWQYIPDTVGAKSREEGKLAYWELVEPKIVEGKHQRGWWRVTGRGEAWLKGEISLSRTARVLFDRVLSYEGEETTFRKALGDHFDYDELMSTIDSDAPEPVQMALAEEA